MKAIVSIVLSQETLGHAVSAYIDNIYVDEDVKPATGVRDPCMITETVDSVWRDDPAHGDWWVDGWELNDQSSTGETGNSA